VRPYSEYYGDSRTKDGLQSHCRSCCAIVQRQSRVNHRDSVREAKKRRYAATRDSILKQKAEYYAKNAERLKPYKQAWQVANREKVYAIAKRHRMANPQKGAARRAQYRAAQLKATPAWADLEKIAKFYEAARVLGMFTGEWHEVDHIVPLQSKLVCGLHVDNNLRVVLRSDNRRKANRHWPDMP